MGKTPASIRGLGRKVDGLSEKIDADRRATTKVEQRVDNLNLNGSASSLRRLADNADKLLRLVELSDYIVAAVEHHKEQEIVNRWLKRTFNPFASKIGAFIWLVVSAAVFAWVASLFSAARH